MAAHLVVRTEKAARFLKAAVEAYGFATLTSAPGGGSTDADFGRQLFWEVFGGQGSAESLHAALTGPYERPGEDNLSGRLFSWVYQLLKADPAIQAATVQALEEFYRRQFEAGNARAMSELADLLLSQSKRPEARAAYRQAADAGYSRALIALARLDHNDRYDPEGARATCQEAIKSTDPDVSSEAQLLLGFLLSKHHHQYADAADIYHRVIDAGRQPWALTALERLAGVRHEQGDLAGQRAIYQQIINSGDAERAVHALVSLGELLESQADTDGAKTAYWRAVEWPTGDREVHGYGGWAAYALVNLVNLLQEQGDLDALRTAYRKAAESGNFEAPYALTAIGSLQED